MKLTDATVKIGEHEYPVGELEIGIDKAEGKDYTALTHYYNGELIKAEFMINVKPFAEGLRYIAKLLSNKGNRELRNKRGSYLIREQRRKFIGN